MARAVASLASDKKASDISILEMTNLLYITDYFIICTAESTTQSRAVAEHIDESLRAGKFRERNIKPLAVEGARSGRWILMDYGDLVVHVFTREARDYYDLDRLWLDAPRPAFDAD